MADDKEVHRSHTHASAFFWKSGLSAERKEEIIAWVKGLDNDSASMLNDLLDDVAESQRWEQDYENSQGD